MSEQIEASTQAPKTFKEAILNKRMLICIFTGFSSGLPLYLVYQLVPAWLRSFDLDLSTIGLFGLLSLTYTFKFLWAPFMDRYTFPFLGRRRGWMLVTQVPLLLLMAVFGMFSPTEDLEIIMVIVALLAFFSGSQDIVLDAYRRELLPDDELGIGSSFFTSAYRFSSFVPGSLALILSGLVPWSVVHMVVASFMLVGIITTFFIQEEEIENTPSTIRDAVIDPFKEFFTRGDSWKSGLLILLFIFCYKLGDNMATALETPFFMDMGFDLIEIGSIAKFSKFGAVIVGTFIGGILMIKLGINKCLWLFGLVQISSIFGYYLLAEAGHSFPMLFLATSLEYLGVGLGGVALIAFMARSTSKQFTATQLALLTSLAAIPRVFSTATSGFIIEAVGYSQFFLICILLAIPGMLLLFKVAPWNQK
jgi:PAT family beta-lactamase induction signal transducer AmpG